jgi:hypothetical protein
VDIRVHNYVREGVHVCACVRVHVCEGERYIVHEREGVRGYMCVKERGV